MSLLTSSCAMPRPSTLCSKMVAFDSNERRKRAVDAIIRAMECTTGTSQQADQPSVPPASAQANKPLSLWSKFDEASASDTASSTYRSPHTLCHEFESYLREPKIARMSSPFTGLKGVHTAYVVRRRMRRDVVRPRMYYVCVVVLIELVQSIGGIHTRRDVVRRRTYKSAQKSSTSPFLRFTMYAVVRRATSHVV